uniref:Odorant receptor n=1 Tax=Eogystia hippophaecolus TaxID=1206364 RepID=A0A1B3P5N5_EOGHI|nr:odorant receptor [Eogystia hippophaecolus]
MPHLKSSVEEEYIKTPPKEQLFYQFLGKMMSLWSLGNQSWWGYKPHGLYVKINSAFVPVIGPPCLISQFVYLYQNFSKLSMSTLGVIFTMIPMTFLVNVKVRVHKTKKYKKLMKVFLSEIHLYNFIEDDNNVKQIVIRIERYTRWMAYCVVMLVTVNWLSWAVIPIVNNLKFKDDVQNKTMQLQTSLYMWMPFDYEHDYQNWIIIHSFNIYLIAIGCALLSIPDVINYVFLFHLVGHVTLLNHRIVSRLSFELTDKEVEERLKDVVEYHTFINKLFKDVESVFGVNISINYLNNLIVDSLLLFQSINQEKGDTTMFIYGVAFVICMGGLILMSFILEEIRNQSDVLPDSLYGVPWENWSIPNKKSFLTILTRLQPELSFVAAGGLRTGVTPMISIIKSTFSYYVMLKSTI